MPLNASMRVADTGTRGSGKTAEKKAGIVTSKTPKQRQVDANIKAKANTATPKKTTTTTTYSQPTVSYETSNNDSSYASALSDYMSSLDSIANKIAEYQKMQDELAEKNYQAQLTANEQSAKEQRNQANLNSARTGRWLDAQYGGGVSGQGISNRLRNKTNLTNNLASINTNLANNNASANLSRYNTLSNNLDNTISRLQTIDDSRLSAKLKYANYLNQLGL